MKTDSLQRCVKMRKMRLKIKSDDKPYNGLARIFLSYTLYIEPLWELCLFHAGIVLCVNGDVNDDFEHLYPAYFSSMPDSG